MKIYFEIFWSFLKIGSFTIGGGWAMVPVIEKEVVGNKGWLTGEEFVDALAIAQSVPGIMAVNIANYIGFHLKGKKGSLFAILGSTLPSFIIILAIALFFRDIKDLPVVERIFKGIRPAVAALILVPVFSTAKSVKLNSRTLVIPVVSSLIIWQFGVSPAYIILLAALGGMFVYGWNQRRKD